MAILVLICSRLLIGGEVYASSIEQKSEAESQVTITFVESSLEQKQAIRKDSENMDPGRSSKTFLPSTGTKTNGLLFVLGVLAFFLSATILSRRRKNRRNRS
ncbi:TPA: LPXTG cell wall anchor domain-containing protein [Enterococcus faecalis]